MGHTRAGQNDQKLYHGINETFYSNNIFDNINDTCETVMKLAINERYIMNLFYIVSLCHVIFSSKLELVIQLMGVPTAKSPRAVS